MPFQIARWRINPMRRGYQTQRQLESGRWITDSYHPSFAEAVESLFEAGVGELTQSYTIQLPEDASACCNTLKRLSEQIETLAKELREEVAV